MRLPGKFLARGFGEVFGEDFREGVGEVFGEMLVSFSSVCSGVFFVWLLGGFLGRVLVRLFREGFEGGCLGRCLKILL